jgi:hypothetical protein
LIKDTFINSSSFIPSLIILGTIKRSGFKRLLKSDTQLKASTLSLDITLIHREKSGLIITAANLKNRIIIIISGNIIKGLSNCLTAINKALKEIQRGLTINLISSVLNTLKIIGIIIKKINDFV